jgi:hypothetical protein
MDMRSIGPGNTPGDSEAQVQLDQIVQQAQTE